MLKKYKIKQLYVNENWVSGVCDIAVFGICDIAVPRICDIAVSHEKDEIKFLWRNSSENMYGTILTKTDQLRSLNAYMIQNMTHKCDDAFSWRGKHPSAATRAETSAGRYCW